jgi:AGZA family xanthine/uracil permease-like MFS transporter
MEGKKIGVPFFRRGDVGGMTYLISNNIVNYLIVIATLTNVTNWPAELVYGRVIPGMSIGLLAGGLYYAFMGHKLAEKEGRSDVTALPSGVSTPAMFVILFGVVVPLHYAIGNPMIEWGAALAACFTGGLVEFLGGIVGPFIKKQVPRAALLGTVAGIGFIWMATQGVFDVFGDPVLGLPILVVAMAGVFGGYFFPKRIPPFVIAIVGGIVYAFALGRSSIDFSSIGWYFPDPVTTAQALFSGFAVMAPYLTIIIPIEIYNFIETMDNVESANAAGDNYSVREAQFADGICTMLSALFGGVVPNTVWLGHAGLKKTGAGIGYSVISGIVLGLAGILGLFSFLSALVPPAVCAITFLWCAVIMTSQAYRACERKHFAAVGVAMVPPVADYLFTQVTGAVGVAGVWTETLETGLAGFNAETTRLLLDNGVMWNGVPAVKAGAIIIGLILGTAVACMIDKRLEKAAVVFLCGAVLSLFGCIHSAALGVYFTSPFMIAYIIAAALCLAFHLGRNSWFRADKDYDYVYGRRAVCSSISPGGGGVGAGP